MNKNENIIGVYGIYDTNTSRWEYVGQSKNVFDRLKKHVFGRLQNVENFEFYLLYEFDEYDLNTMLYYETLSIITLQPAAIQSKAIAACFPDSVAIATSSGLSFSSSSL